MAQFRGTLQGNRGMTHRLGSKTSGLQVRADGWKSGVKVDAWHNGTRDVFDVYATSGSHNDYGPKVCTIYVDGKGKLVVEHN